jgi:hypothetical protein
MLFAGLKGKHRIAGFADAAPILSFEPFAPGARARFKDGDRFHDQMPGLGIAVRALGIPFLKRPCQFGYQFVLINILPGIAAGMGIRRKRAGDIRQFGNKGPLVRPLAGIAAAAGVQGVADFGNATASSAAFSAGGSVFPRFSARRRIPAQACLLK